MREVLLANSEGSKHRQFVRCIAVDTLLRRDGPAYFAGSPCDARWFFLDLGQQKGK